MGGNQYLSHSSTWNHPDPSKKIVFTFYDNDNTFILKDNQYKIADNKLYFTTICAYMDETKCGKSTKKVPYYPCGSPYYGCDWKYRGCEEFNWTYKYYYNVPILGWYEKNNKTYILSKTGFKAVLETKTKFPQLKKLN